MVLYEGDRDGKMDCGGAVGRWSGGPVERWSGGAVGRWSGGTVERWSGGSCEKSDHAIPKETCMSGKSWEKVPMQFRKKRAWSYMKATAGQTCMVLYEGGRGGGMDF